MIDDDGSSIAVTGFEMQTLTKQFGIEDEKLVNEAPELSLPVRLTSKIDIRLLLLLSLTLFTIY